MKTLLPSQLARKAMRALIDELEVHCGNTSGTAVGNQIMLTHGKPKTQRQLTTVDRIQLARKELAAMKVGLGNQRHDD